MAKKQLSYTESMEEVESILQKIESGETDIDHLAKEIERAAQLLQTCKEQLFHTEQEVEKILNQIE